jgi:hypothetical protein
MITQLYPGDVVFETEYVGNWVHINYTLRRGPVSGWVGGNYTRQAPCPAIAAPAPRLPPPPPREVVFVQPPATPPAPPVQPAATPPVVVTVVQGPGGSTSVPQAAPQPVPVPIKPPAPIVEPPITLGAGATDITTAGPPYFTLRDANAVVDSRSNQVRFNRDYKGKIFQDTLTLKSITETPRGSGYDVSFDGADCRVTATDAQRMIDWNKGQQVRVTGSIRTTASGDLQLDACSFE